MSIVKPSFFVCKQISLGDSDFLWTNVEDVDKEFLVKDFPMYTSVFVRQGEESIVYYTMSDKYFDYQTVKLEKKCAISEGTYKVVINVKMSTGILEYWVVFYNNEYKKISHQYSRMYNGKNTLKINAPAKSKSFRFFFKFTGSGNFEISPVYFSTFVDYDDEQSVNVIFNKLSKQNQVLRDKAIELCKKSIALEYSTNYKLGRAIMQLKYAPIKTFGVLKKIRKSYKRGNPLTHRGQQRLSDMVGEIMRLESFGYESRSKIDFPVYDKLKGLKPKPTFDVNIAVIMDTFSLDSFEYEANFIKLNKKEWKRQLIDNQVELLFLESAWNGNNGQWKFMMTSYDKPFAKPLRELIKFAKAKGIPVVFWNKEDPTNFDEFINIAKDCDFIFTTAAEKIKDYKRAVNHENVYSLMFAAQPLIHNPIKDTKLPTYDVCFAGSWYDKPEFEDRKKFTSVVLDGAIECDLHIFDRMYGSKESITNRIFPRKYQKYIVGSLEYDKMLTAYRHYKVFLNVNTIYKSQTMFSRRVFELLACGTPVVSTESRGIERLFSEYVSICNNSDEVRNSIDSILSNPKAIKHKNHLAMREVFLEHTYSKRMERIFKKIGLSYRLEDKKVTTITVTNRINYLENIKNNLSKQKYNNIESIIVLNDNKFNAKEVEDFLSNIENINVKVLQYDEKISLGECFNNAVNIANGDYIAKMDDDDYYGEYYILDAINAFKYSGADIIGKKHIFIYFEEKDCTYEKYKGASYKYIDFITGATIISKTSIMKEIGFVSKNTGEDTNFLIEAKSRGYRIYSTDPYNFLCMRRKSMESHTWTFNVEQFLNTCDNPSNSIDFDRVMV